MPRGRRPKRENGSGSITYRKDRKRWEARITVGYRPKLDGDGRPVLDAEGQPIMREVRKAVSGRTEAEARERLDELHRLHDLGLDLDPNQTLATFLEWWHAEVLPRSVAPGTVKQYGETIRNHIVPTIGPTRLSKLSVRHVDKMLTELAARGLSTNTQRLARSVLRRALRRAEADGLVTKNVAALAEGVKVERKPGRTMSPDQAIAFLQHVQTADSPTVRRLAASWFVALTLGLRRGELLGLSWEDLDLDGDPATIRVRRQLRRIDGAGLALAPLKTEQSRRRVHIPTPTVDALRRHRVIQLEERLAAGDLYEPEPLGANLVFRTPLGTALDPSNYRQATYRATEAALGERWSPHTLRHSAASLLLAQGVELKLIADTLGHSSIRVTGDTYAHLLNEGRATVADAMTRAIGGER